MPQNLQKRMEFHSSYCENHTYRQNGQDIIKPIQRMVINGKAVCPRCELEKETERLKEAEQNRFDELEKQRTYNTLYRQSLISDETLLTATLENYTVSCEEERVNKEIVLECLKRYKDGQTFNVVFQGNPGAGKSHLAYSMLNHLNQTGNHMCLYIAIEDMLRKIRDSFSNKDSKYTEGYFVELLSKVDYLVLDDLGAETGAIDTDKTASDFVQRILYAVTSARQNKCTIYTMNLTSKTLLKMYDSKLVSRLFRNPKYIIFKESKDKRMTSIPF